MSIHNSVAMTQSTSDALGWPHGGSQGGRSWQSDAVTSKTDYREMFSSKLRKAAFSHASLQLNPQAGLLSDSLITYV